VAQLGGELFLEGFAAAEPRAFYALHVAREGALFGGEFGGPFAGFVFLAGEVEEIGVVEKKFGGRGIGNGEVEALGSAIEIADARVGVTEQADGAVVVEFLVFSDNVLEVGDGREVILHGQSGFCAQIEGVGGIAALGDGAVQGFAGFGIILVVEIEVGELFEISGRRIVEDLQFELFDARIAGESLERAAQQTQIGDDFGDDVNACAEHSAEDDDPKPVGFRAAADEMPDGEALEDQSPGIKKMSEAAHSWANSESSSCVTSIQFYCCARVWRH
jgi:hypothetical protein